MHHQSKQNSVKGQVFCHSSCKTVCELIFNYTDTLHSDDFILFTSAKVVLDRRPQSTFCKSNELCVLLLLMPTRPFLNSCLVRACFLGFLHSSPSLSASCSHLSPTALNSIPPYQKMVTSVKLQMQMVTSVKLQMQNQCSLV